MFHFSVQAVPLEVTGSNKSVLNQPCLMEIIKYTDVEKEREKKKSNNSKEKGGN